MLLVGIEFLTKVRFQFLGQADHPVDEAEDFQDQRLRIAALVHPADEAEFPALERLDLVRHLGADLGHHHQGEDVVAGFEFRPALRRDGIEQFDHREAEGDRAAPATMTKLAGAKAGGGVGQDGEANDIQAIAIAQSGLVEEHPLTKTALGVALDFDMNQHRDRLTVERAYAHQFVGITPTARAVGADLLQFLVEKLRRHTPVDLRMNGREQQRQELREEAFQGFFPGAVVVVFERGLGG
ncbi:hypothetical protein CCR95_07900 [Thiocystis minor]|nr:hypothetical protein [Thiocystis minor]